MHEINSITEFCLGGIFETDLYVVQVGLNSHITEAHFEHFDLIAFPSFPRLSKKSKFLIICMPILNF